MEYLSSDVVTEILLRLPAQSLVRFRSVCKSWCNIIDSPAFRKSHLQNQSDDNEATLFLQFNKISLNVSQQFINRRKCELSTQNPIFPNTRISPIREYKWELSILNPSTGKSQKSSFPCFQKFLNDSFYSDQLFVAGLFNGLICIYYKMNHIHSKSCLIAISIAIYNPCLDEIKILPLSPIMSSQGHVEHEFDPIVGFGIDKDKNYKLVHFVKPMSGSTYLEVYSGTTNTWRTLDVDLILWSIQGIKSKSTGSKAYWQIQTGFFSYNILCFDVQNEVFETISYPFADRLVTLSLVEVIEVFVKDDDSFALFALTCDRQMLELWEMQGHERCWTHVTDINLGPFQHGPKLPRPQALWNRDLVVLMEYKLTGCDLVFYDCSSKEVIKGFEMHSHKNKVLRYKTIRKGFREMPKSYTEVLEFKCSLISPINPKLGM